MSTHSTTHVRSCRKTHTDSCGGYAIGFDYGAIREVFRSRGRFDRCRYTNTDQHTLIEAYWQEWEAAALAQGSGLNGEEDNNKREGRSVLEAAKLILGLTDDIVPFVKNEAFSEEEEWRGVIVANVNVNVNNEEARGQIKFREKGNELVPYVEVELPSPLPVKQIVVGPCPRPEESEDSVKLFLRTHNLRRVEVAKSKCPYRGWP